MSERAAATRDPFVVAMTRMAGNLDRQVTRNLENIFGSPPFARGSETSKLAGESMKPCAGSVRALVLEYLRAVDAVGATCDEVERVLELSHQLCSPRFTELRNAGLIKTAGFRRPTRTGRKAEVYIAVKAVK